MKMRNSLKYKAIFIYFINDIYIEPIPRVYSKDVQKAGMY